MSWRRLSISDATVQNGAAHSAAVARPTSEDGSGRVGTRMRTSPAARAHSASRRE